MAGDADPDPARPLLRALSSRRTRSFPSTHGEDMGAEPNVGIVDGYGGPADFDAIPKDHGTAVIAAHNDRHYTGRRLFRFPAIVIARPEPRGIDGHSIRIDRNQHGWMIHVGGRRPRVANDDRHAQWRGVEQQARKLTRKMNATVRLRIAGYATGVQGDTIASQFLGIGHGRVVIQAGMMVLVLKKRVEDPRRSFVALLAAADRAGTDLHAIAVRVGPLLIQADHHENRSFRRDLRRPGEFAGLQILGERVIRDRGLRAPERHTRRMADRHCGEKKTEEQADQAHERLSRMRTALRIADLHRRNNGTCFFNCVLMARRTRQNSLPAE